MVRIELVTVLASGLRCVGVELDVDYSKLMFARMFPDDARMIAAEKQKQLTLDAEYEVQS